MEEWDGDKANDYFIAKRSKINIEGARYKANRSSLHKDLHDIDLADRDFYSKCARKSFSKERFADFLSLEKIVVANSESFDPKQYLKSYNEEFEIIKAEFESGVLLKKILSS